MVRSSFRLASLAAALLSLTGCLAEIDNTIIANPIDVKPYEGYWINTKGGAAELLSIKARDKSARSASVKYIHVIRETQDVSQSLLTVQATEINNALYVEVIAEQDSDKATPPGRIFGRFHLGTTETPDDRDKLTACFAETSAMKGAVEKGQLKGTIVHEPSYILPRDKVRITSSTAELRAYLAAHPLDCRLFSTSVFIRAKPHFPTFR